jgi:integrase
MAKSHLKLVSLTTVNRTVAPLRRPNSELRTREYLTDAEIGHLIDTAKANRYGHRDATMVLLGYRHGLRASELVDLRWDQIDFGNATLAVRRAKKGTPSTHPIRGDELRALRRLAREQDPKSPFVFTSERGAPFGKWKGELTDQEHTPAPAGLPTAGKGLVAFGFNGTYTDDGAQFYATALVGKRSLQYHATLRLLVAD